MIEINELRDVYSILFSERANSEIVGIVKTYFQWNDKAYYKLVKFYWYDERQVKYNLGITLNEYRKIKDKIVTDIRALLHDYYSRREKKFKKLKNVTDLVTYQKNIY